MSKKQFIICLLFFIVLFINWDLEAFAQQFVHPRFLPVRTVFIRQPPRPVFITRTSYITKTVYARHHHFWYKLGRGIIGGSGIALGLHFINRSEYLSTRPLMRRTLKGMVIGGGVGFSVASRATLPGLLIGSAIGIGTHYVMKLRDHRSYIGYQPNRRYIATY